jgi:hypothetical protein
VIERPHLVMSKNNHLSGELGKALKHLNQSLLRE